MSGKVSARWQAQTTAAAKVAASTSDGQDLVDYFVSVFRNPELNHGSRTKAAEWLADRLWGKTPQTLEVNTNQTVDLTKLTAEELDQLERLYRAVAVAEAH